MPRSPEVGDQLGRYRLVEELGRGGMAVVFRAEDPTLGREVAIKVMHPHLWGASEYATRFTREARAVAALHHPSIVEVYDYGEGQEKDGLPGYIVSEFVKGPTLRQFIDSHGCPFPEVAVMVARKLAAALKCAHGCGIIHRDLKPENIMVAAGGRIVLTDFGIARITEGEAVTQTGALLGSPAYMSPEQARGLPVDVRSDLFSLGVVLYLLCTGSLPFPGSDPISTVIRILEGDYEPPLKRNPRIGSRLDRAIRKLLQTKAEDRYADTDEVMAELDRVLDEAGIDNIDDELLRYFDDPGSFNRTLLTRVLERSLTLAQQASESGDYPRALAFCDRVLSFEPEHQQALELMARVSSGGRGWGLALWVGLGMLLGGIAIGAYFWHVHGQDPARSPDAGRVVSTPHGPDQRVLDQRQPDQQLPDAVSPDLRRTRPPLRPRRRDAAMAAVVPRLPDAQVTRPDLRAAPRPPAPTHGEIVVAIGTWCEVYLDGKHVGRSPMRETPLRVTPGTHEVICQQGAGGPKVRHVVKIAAGERRTLAGLLQAEVQVRLQLRHGDAVRIDGKTYQGPVFRIAPSRRRVDVLRGGKVVQGGAWVTFGRTCTLVDEPELRCR